MTTVLDEPRLAKEQLRRVTPEGAALAALAWAMWYLGGHDGGLDLRDAVRAMAPLVVALPAAALGVAGIRRPWGLVVAAFCGGLAASVAFGGYRADAVAPLLVYSGMLVAGLAAVAIVRRPWGPPAMLAVVVIGGARLWWSGLEVWYGSSLSATAPDRWMSLPWHNQSAIAMAVPAIALGTIAAMATRRDLAVAAAVGAALAGAATYLAGSRGSLVALALGVAVALGAVPRSWRRWLIVAAGALVAVFVLTHLPGASGSDPGESAPAVESSAARLAHWEAALGMLADRPLTGHGVGSYRLASSQWASGDANPSSHAHNEFIEFFAEGGLALGIPAAVLVAGIGIAAMAALRRERDEAIVVASAAAWLALGAHAGIDFDWLFPFLALVFAITGGIVVGSAAPTAGGRWPAVAVGAVFIVVLGAGFVEGFRQEPGAVHPPWNARGAVAVAERALDAGDTQRALAIASAASKWNPADPRPDVISSIARLDTGEAAPTDVVAAARQARPGFGVRLDAARLLLARGHVSEAEELVTEVIDMFDSYQGWRLGGAAAVAYRLDVDIAGRSGGCAAAGRAAANAASTELANVMGTEDYSAQAARYCG